MEKPPVDVADLAIAYKEELLGTAEPAEVAAVFLACVHRVGELGNPAAEAIREALDSGDDTVTEGLMQLEDVIDVALS